MGGLLLQKYASRRALDMSASADMLTAEETVLVREFSDLMDHYKRLPSLQVFVDVSIARAFRLYRSRALPHFIDIIPVKADGPADQRQQCLVCAQKNGALVPAMPCSAT